ncbi:hypothetical protein D3C85_1665110 [compost metagenome]
MIALGSEHDLRPIHQTSSGPAGDDLAHVGLEPQQREVVDDLGRGIAGALKVGHVLQDQLHERDAEEVVGGT